MRLKLFVVLLPLLLACGERQRRVGPRVINPSNDAGPRIDTGMAGDAGTIVDTGLPPVDAGTIDTGVRDTGARDTGAPDTGRVDAGPPSGASVYDVKAGFTTAGTVIAAEGLMVTGLFPEVGFFAQVSPSSPDYAGVERSGIFVYTPSELLPNLGQGIDITSATTNEFFGEWQLQNASWVGSTASPVTPVTIDEATATANLNANVYEGVLVRVTNLTVFDNFPLPGPGDDAFDEVEMQGGLRVDDLLGYTLDPFPTVGTSYSGITGVLAWRNEYTKLLPRFSSDVTP